MRRADLVGMCFGQLSVVSFHSISSSGKSVWNCLCSCGKMTVVPIDSLKSGSSKSCSCLRGKNLKTHGLGRTSIHKLWTGMKQRCENRKSYAYKNYGGRGIFVCERWQKFESFYKDVGEKPKGMSLDRIDNNGPYSPANCKWSTYKEQSLNKRRSPLYLTIDITHISKVLGVSYSAVRSWYRKGLIDEKTNVSKLLEIKNENKRISARDLQERKR